MADMAACATPSPGACEAEPAADAAEGSRENNLASRQACRIPPRHAPAREGDRSGWTSPPSRRSRRNGSENAFEVLIATMPSARDAGCRHSRGLGAGCSGRRARAAHAGEALAGSKSERLICPVSFFTATNRCT